MTATDVLRRDLTSVYRARTVPVVALVMLGVSLGAVLLLWWLSPPGFPPVAEGAVLVVGTLVGVVVPFVALVATYGAIVGERATGSVRYLVGLPNARLDAFAGKYAARTAAVAGPLAVGMALSAPVFGLAFEGGSTAGFLLLGLFAALYATCFVGLGLAVSAASATPNRAVVGVVGVYAALRGGWPALQAALLHLAGSDPYPPFPGWYFWVGRVNPMNAFVKLTTLVADFRFGHQLLSREQGVETVAASHEFALAVLLAWVVVPPALGYLAFRDADLV